MDGSPMALGGLCPASPCGGVGEVAREVRCACLVEAPLPLPAPVQGDEGRGREGGGRERVSKGGKEGRNKMRGP